MADIVKRVSINQVTVGMYLEDVFDGKGVMLFCANTQMTSEEQIDKLRQRGVLAVFINTAKGADVAPAPGTPPPQTAAQREAAYYQEIEKAKVIHQAAFDTIRKTLQAIRVNRAFSPKGVEKAAEEMVGSIMRNPDAMISLSQIKGYDEYTYVHSVNVGILAGSLARELGYKPEDVVQVSMGGLMHDIGKMRVPESILNKPGKYVDWEFKIMKKHPDHGLEIIGEEYKEVSDIARSIVGGHHERYNGSGYPGGLKGSEISESALVGAVADVYDALTTERVYRVAWTPQRALALLFQGCDIEYSRTIVERFTKYIGIYPVGSFVKLVSGELGVVTRVDRGHLLAPTMQVLFDVSGRRLKEPLEYDLLAKQAQPDGKQYVIEISLNPTPYRVKIADYIVPGAT